MAQQSSPGTSEAGFTTRETLVMSSAAWAQEGSGRVSQGEEGRSPGELHEAASGGGSRPEGVASPCDVAAGLRGNDSPNLLLQQLWLDPA